MVVVVTAAQDAVWVSISPPFTGDAIMEAGKVDELVHVLKLAQQEAKRWRSRPMALATPANNQE
jgi:hypothetical protein